MLNIIKKLMTDNDCYRKNEKINPSMIFVHSTATPGVTALQFVQRWNKPSVKKAVHFFVDDTGVYQVLPAEPGNCMRAWHCGKSGNDMAAAFEICEPKNLDDKEYFAKAYANAAALTAKLCKDFNIPAGSVICHCEGYKMGIASNHADVMHWFPRHGVDMDNFRADVAALLESENFPEQPAEPEKPTIPGEKKLYRVQTGAFKSQKNADKLLKELLGKGYDGYVKAVDGYYKVQVGAYSKEENAKAMSDKLKKAGYATHLVVTTKPGDVVQQPKKWVGEATTRVNVRTGAGTNYNNLTAYPKLNAGNRVEVVGAKGEWYQVKIAGKYVGWVYADYIREV